MRRTYSIDTLADAESAALALLNAMPEITQDEGSELGRSAEHRAYLDATTAAYLAIDDALAALNDASRTLKRSKKYAA